MARDRVFDSPAELVFGSWEDIVPRYEELATRPILDLEAWLRDWSELERFVGEAATLASIGYTADTADPEKERVYLLWTGGIQPRLREQGDRLARRLLEADEIPTGLETPVRRFRNQVELFRAENLPLQGELSRLSAAYQKVTGGMTVEWDGGRLTLPQVVAKIGEADRPLRERAFRLSLQPYVDQRGELARLFDEMRALRAQTALNAGYADYRAYAHQEKNRFDYTPDDSLRWDEAVEEAIVPAARRVLERRRMRMGLETLRPWDLIADPLGRPQLRPFDRADELSMAASRIFEAVDPALGGYFRIMVAERLLDLESRPAKAPGGYCAVLPHRRRSFIFMNAAGVDADVRTLVHEAGHAFHNFEKLAAQPLVWQQTVGSELAEFASMSMELLAMPFLPAAEGGLYSEADARRARASYLESVVLLFGHIASVDAFQHWIYTSREGADADARDEKWLELRARFEPAVDWSGLESYRKARWYAQQHIFQFPFYYIEYGLARLAALQVWHSSLEDREGAVARYRAALAMGGSRPLPEVYAAAGARLVFDPAGMRELIQRVEAELEATED
jgi:oligoendopeptidase F